MRRRKSTRALVPWLMMALALWLACAALPGCGSGGGDLSARVRKIIESPEFAHSPWAIYVVDTETGEKVYESYNPDMMIDPASTTKLFSVATAMETLGKDHKFNTPVYATGPLGAGGVLSGDLVMVADGDISLGGRTLPGDKIEYTSFDHTDANALGNCELTKTDPLAGLDAMAAQVAASGIRTVSGDVVIDDRLYGPQAPFAEGVDYVLTPIMVNDNLVDLMVTPGSEGAAATVDWRPKSSTYTVESSVTTGKAGGEAQLELQAAGPGVISITGQVPADGGQVVRTFAVDDPAAFARSLFIEALGRAGVTVRTPAGGANPAGKLPAADSYTSMKQAAVLESPPFSEYAKLVLKVSHNPGADTCLLLSAVEKGGKTLEDGLAVEAEFLKKTGIDTKGLIFNDGQGSFGGGFAAPKSVVGLLQYMSKSKDFKEYFACLPIMGVDGTLKTLMQDSPVKGKAQAKTGTHVGPNGLSKGLWVSRALGGYMTAKSGRKLTYDIVVGIAPAAGMEDLQTVNTKHGQVLEAIYEQY